MRAMLTVCLCAAGACRGGAAQEPYDGVIAAARRPAKEVPALGPVAAERQQVASEIDVPWTIALLSSAKTASAATPAKVVVEADPEVIEITLPEIAPPDVDVQLAIDPRLPEGKPASSKACSGLVKTRS